MKTGNEEKTKKLLKHEHENTNNGVLSKRKLGNPRGRPCKKIKTETTDNLIISK